MVEFALFKIEFRMWKKFKDKELITIARDFPIDER